MSLEQSKIKLIDFLEHSETKNCQVVVMPDFFLDRIINLNWDVSEFSNQVEGVVKRKGGSIDGVPQIDMKGGNAINAASALASLGVNVTPIVCTSELGLQQIKFHFRNTPIDTSYIKIHGKASMTTALEFRAENEKTNVMIRDLGALSDFGPGDLTPRDLDLIDKSDYTCVFNWAGTLKHGTELVDAVFTRIKSNKKSKTFYDTADPNPNAKGILDLMNRVLRTDKVDILSLNENEAITYASLIQDDLKEKIKQLPFSQQAMEAARVLAKHFPARIDLHTSAFSATLKEKQETVVPAFKVKVWRATGAGDAWNAGNILADHNGLSDEARLMLANAVSACYLSGEDGMHPTKEKLSAFLKANA